MSSNLKCTCPKCKFEYVIPLDKDLVRTLPQNSLYWSVYVKTIAEHLGYFPDEMHEEFKIMFNPKDSKIRPGEKFGGTTTKLKRKEFSEYLDSIRIWALREHNINLPEPEEKE